MTNMAKIPFGAPSADRLRYHGLSADAERKVICRYRRRNGDMCTGEVLDPDGDILLCARHLAAAASEFRRLTEQAQR